MPSPRAIVLLSGGLDSAVCLAVARSDGFDAHALAFDYGQRHRHELVASSRVARALGAASHKVLTLDLRAIGGSALTADLAVPKDRVEPARSADPNADIPVTYVPARNLVFLSLAVGYAEVLGATDIYIGVNAVDYSGYPDCRPEFIRAFEAAARLGTRTTVRGGTLRVRTPLLELSKAQIIMLGRSLGVDFSITHSCYDPVGERPCGHCDSCVIRRRGFEAAGSLDPTLYPAPTERQA